MFPFAVYLVGLVGYASWWLLLLLYGGFDGWLVWVVSLLGFVWVVLVAAVFCWLLLVGTFRVLFGVAIFNSCLGSCIRVLNWLLCFAGYDWFSVYCLCGCL